MITNRDKRDTWDFPQPALEVFVVGSDDVASVLLYSIDKAVVRVGALVAA